MGGSSDLGSWSTLLDIIHDLADERGFDRIVLGGFGLLPKTKQAKRIAFDEAWKAHLSELAEQVTRPSHSAVRLALVPLLMTATRQRRSKTERNVRWWIALFLGTWGLAAGVAVVLPSICAIGLGFGPAVMIATVVLMAVAGWFSQEVLTFDVKDELRQ